MAMILPEFISSPTFIDKVHLPCLVGKVIESRLPELGLLHEDTKNGKVPGFQIWLRCRKPQQLSAWHRHWLHRLFEEGKIIAAIRDGMKEYEIGKKWCGYEGATESELSDIEKHGILRYLVLRSVVLDELERKILFRLGTDKDVNLEEHGITICWKRGRWRFGYADVISDYLQNLDPFDQAEQPRRTAATTDLSFWYGRWVFDEEATAELLRARGMEGDVSSIVNEMRNSSYTISENSLRVSYNGKVSQGTIISHKLTARKLSLTVKYPQWETPVDFEATFRNKNLICGDFALSCERK